MNVLNKPLAYVKNRLIEAWSFRAKRRIHLAAFQAVPSRKTLKAQKSIPGARAPGETKPEKIPNAPHVER
jgi:hypothetical protein